MPLKATQTTDSKMPKTPARKPRPESFAESSMQVFSPARDEVTHIDADDGSSHRKNGVQKRMLQKLKRGQFPLSDQLDLHHMIIATAHIALLEFIADQQDKTVVCIRIIHGKGLRSANGPRLKIMTRQVLRDHPQVLAFTACKPADGGTGAMDVLLKSL